MKKLLLTTATLIALAAPIQAQAQATYIDAAALLAEYVTTCGGRPTQVAMRDVKGIIDRIGFKKWFDAASWVHLERDEDMENQFCSDAYEFIAHLLEREPVDFRPRKEVMRERPPPPAELDLNELPRRLWAGWCRLPYKGLISNANKQACP